MRIEVSIASQELAFYTNSLCTRGELLRLTDDEMLSHEHHDCTVSGCGNLLRLEMPRN